MNRKIFITLVAAVLALGGIEGLAYWWMHPATTEQGEPVLEYERRESGTSAPPGDGTPARTITPLPELVARYTPSLRCSKGTAARIDRDDGVTIHLGFFEWDHVENIDVWQAYAHPPEECMGSIGMTLIEHRPPRAYRVGNETLSFDHTVFRDPAGVVSHAFKCTWVAGVNKLSADRFQGGGQARRRYWQAALIRFRPAHARVAQGAVRGIRNPDAAWQAFEDAMLKDLRMEALP